MLNADDPTDLIVSDTEHETSKPTGVLVEISEIEKGANPLWHTDALHKIGERFALYLNQYRRVKVVFFDQEIDPTTFIESIESFDLSPIESEGDIYRATYDIVKWTARTERKIYLCDEEGFPLAERPPKFHVPGFDFVGYLKSNYFQKLVDENLIALDDLNENVRRIFEEAKSLTKRHYRNLKIDTSRAVIDQWKRENVYPYSGEPETEVKSAERQVFDLVAISVRDHIADFDNQPDQAKRLSLELLRQALEKSPSDLKTILEHVIKLPEKKVTELAKLLEDVSLSNIIEASAIVSDRLVFLDGLEELIYADEHRKDLLERTQLHQIVAQNVWLFGEQYALTVSDKSLTAALRRHAKITKADIVIDRPVKRSDGRVGIVDLMLSRSAKPVRSGEIEHLVIELKRPTVKVGQAELMQIFSYADAVASDPRFAVGHAEWDFWVVSSEMSDDAKKLANKANLPPGLYHEGAQTNPKVRIWAKTWSEIINDAKFRMQFYKDQLRHEVSSESAVRRLKETYHRYFEVESDLVSEHDIEEDFAESVT